MEIENPGNRNTLANSVRRVRRRISGSRSAECDLDRRFDATGLRPGAQRALNVDAGTADLNSSLVLSDDELARRRNGDRTKIAVDRAANYDFGVGRKSNLS